MPRQPTNTSHLRDLLGTVNIRSITAVYVQIENTIRFAIASGRLKADDQLPSVREFSEWLQVNPNTIAKAYRDLEVMGFLYTRRGMGVYINKGVQAGCRDKVTATIVGRLFEICCEAKAAGMSGGEVKQAATASYKAADAPYGEVPKEVMALAKRKK